ncbi:hypothetical protein BC936DRAFT_148966 [Jimgerdemannia flammicorona]|uniref:Protein kinase domain-containing protein n=1 Tax=Jimgerdemannia flammicorona TaxID=994334 RepID=A0A433D1W5_9FUNG|nr:hypothetical protein BC936DRAFT_148966 [Jimgerdemannia flammicorona]
MPQTHFDNELSLLPPVNELSPSWRKYIKSIKSQFPFDDKLKQNLSEIGLSTLAPYLAWVPFELLSAVKEVAKGGYARVYRADVAVPKLLCGLMNRHKIIALKEIQLTMLREVVNALCKTLAILLLTAIFARRYRLLYIQY